MLLHLVNNALAFLTIYLRYYAPAELSFEDKLKQFLSSSERKMADLNRNISGKQGGRRRR